MIGQTISHYRILEKLGEGGMGVVYKAEDTRLQRTVALKFLPLQKSITKDDSRHLIREAQAAARLNHPNIATIFDFLEVEDPSNHSTRAFIAMEYVEGQTLGDLLHEGPFPTEKAVAIGLQLADALSLAHQRGIVHLDLKPANIILTPDGTAKVLDFGIAKLVEEQTHSTSGRVAGSVLYMSPEQIQGSSLDHRSDLFSLGVILYEMVAGGRPFQGDHEPALFYSIINSNPLPLSQHRSNVPEQLQTIILRLLEKNPSNRFQKASEVRQALTRLQPPGAPETRLHNRILFRLLAIALAGFLGIITFLNLWYGSEETAIPSINVAITEFDNFTGEPNLHWMTRGIADIAFTDLSQSRYLSVVPMARIGELLGSVSLGEEHTERDKFVAARKANATILVIGSIVKAGEALRVLTKIYDLRTGNSLSTEQVDARGSDHFFEMADEVTRNIRLVLEIEATDPTEKDRIVQARTHSVEAYREFVKGGAFIEKQYYEDAIRHLQKALEFDSTFARAHNSLAHVYDVLGERALAEESIQKAIRFSKGLPEIDQTMISLHNAQLRGNWDEEFRLVQQMALRQPYEPSWHFRLGWHYFAHKRDYIQSVHHYRRALEFDSTGYPLTYHYLGHAYLNWGKGSDAIDAFARHAALRPQDALAHEALGTAYRLTGRYDEAREQFTQALKLKPSFTSALMNLGILSKEEGKAGEAERYFRDFLSQGVGTSDRIDGHYQLARLHWEFDRPARARTEIMQCLSMDSVFIPGLWMSGLLYLRTGDRDSAATVVDRLDAMTRPSKTQYQREYIHHLRGSVFLARQQHRESIAEFQSALDLGPLEQAFFRFSLAEAYQKAKQTETAIKTLIGVLDLNPSCAPAHMLLARIYKETGNRPQAIFHCSRVLEIRKNADANDRLYDLALQLRDGL